MKEHLLVEKAKRYETKSQLQTPENCTFQGHSGYWINNATGKPMMLGNNPQKCGTKKEDVETGEDQKGE